MTIIEAINTIDSLEHNTYLQQDKIGWLSRADSQVKRLIIDTHEGAENVEFSGYDTDTDVETPLLMEAPFDEAYLRWMEAQIHYHNGEYDRYNNAITLYNQLFQAFGDFYNRNHRPKSLGQFRF